MKPHLLAALRGFFILALCWGCDDSPAIPSEQKVFFEMSYINFAWAHSHEGYFIAADGEIKTYSKPDGWDDREGDNSEITPADLEKILLQTTTLTGYRVEKAELDRQAEKILQIKRASLSAASGVGADMGTLMYYAYRYDTKRSVYRRIPLYQEGDWVAENPDPAARELYLWMKSLYEKIYAAR